MTVKLDDNDDMMIALMTLIVIKNKFKNSLIIHEYLGVFGHMNEPLYPIKLASLVFFI